MQSSDERSLTVRLTILLTAAIVVVLVVINWSRFFTASFLEEGDLAANALQIERCKLGVEIYGNYSRFHFNHPGPAFFYVYALGQAVLHDWLGVVPSPHNAHLLASLCLQSFFFALSLAIFRRHVRALMFVPLALVFAAVHYAQGRHAFTSLWAPHAPLMPFLCLFAASCSVAFGCGTHLPALILAGGFLVHGHVAQPLFVVSFFVGAYGLLWLRLRAGSPRTTPLRRFARAHAIAGGLLFLCLLPLVIDWLQWPDANLARILGHLRSHGDDHKTVSLSLVYLLSFFAYLHDQDQILADGARIGLARLAEHWRCFAGWAAVFTLLAWRHWRHRRVLDDERVRAERGFFRTVVVLWIVGVSLCVVWGTMQAGPMHEFNGHFYFSLLFVPLLLLASTLSRWWGERATLLQGVGLCAGAIAAAMLGLAVDGASPIDRGQPTLAATEALMAQDPRPEASKVIVLEIADWHHVAGTMIALNRQGVPFEVDPMWGYVFGRYRALPPQAPTPTLDGKSVWRFLRRPPAGVGVPYVGGTRVTFEPGRLDPAGEIIECGIDGRLDQFLVSGFQLPDGSDSNRGVHNTVAGEAVFQVASPLAERDIEFSIRARAFLIPPVTAQPMQLWVNGSEIGSVSLPTGEEGDVTQRIPASVWNRGSPVTLVMRLPNARSLRELGASSDVRAFGWAVRRIGFRYVD